MDWFNDAWFIDLSGLPQDMVQAMVDQGFYSPNLTPTSEAVPPAITGPSQELPYVDTYPDLVDLTIGSTAPSTSGSGSTPPSTPSTPPSTPANSWWSSLSEADRAQLVSYGLYDASGNPTGALNLMDGGINLNFTINNAAPAAPALNEADILARQSALFSRSEKAYEDLLKFQTEQRTFQTKMLEDLRIAREAGIPKEPERGGRVAVAGATARAGVERVGLSDLLIRF